MNNNFIKKLSSIILILCLVLIIIWQRQNNNSISDKLDLMNKNYIALNDSIHIIKTDNGIAFQKLVVQSTPEDIINSVYFNNLSKDQQNFYKELVKVKGLLSATQAQLHKQDSILGIMTYSDGVEYNDSQLCFELGHKESISDTTKMLKWSMDLEFKDSLKYNFKYTYDPTININYTKDKDKNIKVYVSLNDPNVVVTKLNSLTIPADQPKSNFGKWYKKHENAFKYMGGVILLGTGYVLGRTF